MGWLDKDLCIKCDEGGEVLVCSDSGCPIAVHEECLGFPAKFDEMGRFYCPHCMYRQAVKEAHQAREKALSRRKALSEFLDMKMTSGDLQTQKNGESKGKELCQVLAVDRVNSTGSSSSGSRPGQISIHNHKFAPKCSRYVLLAKGIDESFLGDRNGVLRHNKGDIAGSSDCTYRIFVVGRRTESGPIVASGNECASSDREEATKRFEMLETGNEIEFEPQWQQDDSDGKVAEDQPDGNNLRESPAIEKQGMENHLSPEAKMVDNDGDTLDENDGRLAGQEEDEWIQQNPAISPRDPGLEMHLHGKRSGQTSDSISTESSASIEKHSISNDGRKRQNVEATCLRRSSQNSASHLRANERQFDKTHACSKLQKPKQPILPPYKMLQLSTKRKKLLWTDAEVEMLKEGVEKFTTNGNRNIPWRKILEFGRHVFDGSRTPVDLKDKWRNMFVRTR